MQQPIAVLAGRPAWAPRVTVALSAAGYATVSCTDPGEYIARLVDLHAAVVLVDGDADTWPAWVIDLKVRQETRRIPAIVVTAARPTPPNADEVGADAACALADGMPALVSLVRGLARVPDAEQERQLATQCAQSLPPRAREGVERFNRGDFYAQHDLFEAEWVDETGPVRVLYRAILQVGVAYYHVTRGNRRGALKMLQRSAQWFAALPDACQGVDVRQLRKDAAAVQAQLVASPSSDLASFDRALLKPIRLLKDA